MRVMVVEDDAALSLFLEKALELEGHAVHVVADGAAAVQRLQEDSPDMLILDLGLPNIDGVDVLRALQGSVSSTSILVLTGRNEIATKIECLNLGADDYLIKPFSMYEMLARCRAIGRRRMNVAVNVLHHGDLRMDRIHRRVTYGSEVLDFTSKEFSLLEYLLRNKGKGVSRRELLESVWQMSPDAGTNVVDVYVNYLRRKLDAVGGLGMIETIRGEGYGIGAKGQLPLVGMRPQPTSVGRYSVSREVA